MSKRQKSIKKKQEPIKKIPPNVEEKGAPKVQIPSSKPKPPPAKKGSSGSSKK